MSTHDEIEELADLAAAGAWEPDAHATSCAACAATLTAAREFRAWAAGAITPDAPPADLEERIISRFRATGTAAARRFRLLPGKRVLKWAAGAAAVVGLVVLGGSFAPPDAPASRELLDVQDLAVAQADFRSNDYDSFWESNGLQPEGKALGYLGTVDRLTLSRRNLGVSTFSLAEGIDGGLAFQEHAKRDVAGLGEYSETLRRGEAAGRGADGTRRADLSLETKLTADAQVAGGQLEVESTRLRALERKLAERSGVAGEDKATEFAAEPAFAAEPEALKAAAEKPLTHAMSDFPGVDIRLAQDARKLIRGARLTMEVEAYEAAQAKVAAAAVEEKGFVASADTERLQNGKIRATVTLRVPPDRFEALLAKLRALGTVKQQSLGTQDVTKGYVDMEARLGAKQALLDRLKKVLAEAKGNVKELMEVEVQMGATLEQIEALKGELKYLDNQIGLATITLEIAEKDLGQPFEYVQTLQSRIGLVSADVDATYAAAQKIVLDAGGQVVDSKMSRQNDGAATGTIRARVEAAKFPGVREALRNLDHVETDTVDQQKSARGGEPTSVAPVRVEQATIQFSVSTPALLVSRRAQLRVETKDVEAVYLASRKSVETAGGRVLDGGLSKRSDGGSASLTVQVDVDKFAALVEAFKASGEVKHAVVNQSAGAVAVPVRERAEVILQLQSPPALIGEEHGIARTVRDTFGRSWTGLLWSVEKLFVGLSLAGPWALAVVAGWLLWRRARRPKASVTN
ncbi:MAG TPA: DUF4349 domain-containing protein [Planctomycetota bacterium]